MRTKRLTIILAVIAMVSLMLGLVYYAFFMSTSVLIEIEDMMKQLPRYYPDDFAKIIEAARKEGGATFYNSMLPEELGGILTTQVEKLYGIKVNLYSAGA